MLFRSNGKINDMILPLLVLFLFRFDRAEICEAISVSQTLSSSSRTSFSTKIDIVIIISCFKSKFIVTVGKNIHLVKDTKIQLSIFQTNNTHTHKGVSLNLKRRK